MAAILVGRIGWGYKGSREGDREYFARHLVQTTDPQDGPATVLYCPGLPAVGSFWALGNDMDAWAYCTPEATVSPKYDDEICTWWVVEQAFSTRPIYRCQTDSIENPLNEPMQLSGSFVKYTKEVSLDKNGNAILNSAKEPLSGQELEFDHHRATVRIQKNILSLPLTTYTNMMNKVNDATLWGCDPRCVKLSNVSWERKLYGVCTYYYTVTYEFDIDFETFDKEVADRGRRTLLMPPPTGVPLATWKLNPKNYVIAKDLLDENAGVMLLDGAGNTWDGTGTPGKIQVQYYKEANFLTLGIPTSL